MFRMFWNLNVLDEAITFMKYVWDHPTSYFTGHIIRQIVNYEHSTVQWFVFVLRPAGPGLLNETAVQKTERLIKMVKQTRSQLHRWEQVTTVQMGANTAAQLGAGHGCTGRSGHTCTVYWQELAAAQAGAGQNWTDGKRSQFHRWKQVTAQLGTSCSCTCGSRSQVHRWEQSQLHNLEQVTAQPRRCTGWSWTAAHLGEGHS
jgi:hypothetical protein